jgi:outer membrane protein assembly factor BamA
MKYIFFLLLFFVNTSNIFSQEPDSASAGFAGKLYFNMSPKEKIKLDTIVISGNKVTQNSIILKELSFSQHDSISLEILDYNKNRIYSTGLFTKIDGLLYQQTGKKVLEIHVDERWYLYPYPIIGIKDRNWNNFYYGLGLAHINFLGLNQKLFGSFALGYDPFVNFHYFNPDFITDDFMFDVTLSHSKTKNKSLYNSSFAKDFYEYWYNLQISAGNRIDIYKTIWLSLGYSQINVTEKNVNKTISPSGKDEFLTVNISGEINTRDMNEYPMKGRYLSAAIKKCGFGESKVDYLQAWFDAREYLPVIYNWSLGFRGFTGLTIGNTLPNYSHYFLGYSERIRGKFNEVMEGENISGFSSELRIPILGPTYHVLPDFPIPQFAILRYGVNAAFFFDAGEVWNKHCFKWDQFTYGYGFGLHFLLPYSVVIRTEIGFDKLFRSEFIFDAGVSF